MSGPRTTVQGRLRPRGRLADTAAEDDQAATRARLRALYRAGRLDEATQGYQALLADLEGRGRFDVRVFAGLAVCHFMAGRKAEAAAVCQAGLARFPDSSLLHENLGMCLTELGDHAGAVRELEATLALGKRHWSVHDGLAQAHAYLGDLDQARRHGDRSLTLKDAEAAGAAPAFALPDHPPPPFDPTRRTANVIAYSLWGDDGRYLAGAVRNALLIPEIYPGWVARFYVGDGVPASATERLTTLGAEVVPRDGPSGLGDGLFWRFEAACDPAVARFLIRDADSIVNTQERAAVDEWLASDRYFHVMRDWWTHTDLMLAGMWGGCGGVLPELAELRARFAPDRLETLNVDQDFLRLMVWPAARASCLIHDGCFDCLDSRPFPAVGRLPAGMHVGQDLRARRIRQPVPRDRRRAQPPSSNPG